MTGDLFTIGQLARTTGLPVKTIRYWSDQGLVPPAGRTAAGYRLYDQAALVRLGFVRTLRDLDLDLATIRRLADRDLALDDVARTHARALDIRIRALQLQRSVLRAVAHRAGTTTEEIALMHKLAALSDTERKRLIHDFIDDTFADLDLGEQFLPLMRAAMPELPEQPSQRQLDAWIELAELVSDPDFRSALRSAAQAQARAVAEVGEPSAQGHQDMAGLLHRRVSEARQTGVAPDSPQAAPVVDELAAAYAEHTGSTDTPAFRQWLADLMDASTDRRYERYWDLLAVINDGPRPDTELSACAEWLTAAPRAGLR
ncbi:MerR family transcriptional regulator [Saccharopolyspora sp. HNM0983]|uniref:MerR family transcriptional regulator n=1 Tax=Saccharopolyspora montiporae TaxID=2781240 RepID=A0A929BA91_9PSEU|nr:MerR family transcriptional regulator [Saccharopolyspora sp. HNM0983]MBE9376184.1 MerR family transcriptional regulator [Saccharopolyspora sp. HNM0983]